ncbi:hypothetical protein FRB93_005690 [Tulasnella sp. JGI-2019a]|nr:hypothetical protein FRB93_005690 [Tulasnella sp. JGI-2019a]
MRFGVDWFYFSGAPSEDVLPFAQAIHKVAFASGRLEDDAWKAQYGYGCLQGAALHWYESLEPETKDSWSKLRQAMIERFPPMELVPGAPAAAPVPGLTSSNLASRCRILVVRGNGNVIGYVGPLCPRSDTIFLKSPNGALLIDVPILQHPRQPGSLIRMLPPSQQAAAFPFVGVECHGNFWNLRACDEGRSEKIFNCRARAYTPTGAAVASSRIWSLQIDQNDGSIEELHMDWVDDKGVAVPIKAFTYPKHIDSVSASKTFWMRTGACGDEEPLKLILERF